MKVREMATVTVQTAVDGTKRRRPAAKRPRNGKVVTVLVVDPRVMKTARKVIKPGQRLVIIDEQTVELVNHH